MSNPSWKLLDFAVGLDQPLFLMAGPCVIESEQLAIDTAGYLKEVTRHVEKIIRMGLALKGDAATPFVGLQTLASAPNPFIELVFPAITSPSDADISEKISMLRDSHLSAEEKAKLEAQVFGITDEAEIGEIQANWEEAAKIAEPTVPNFGGA